ncbi:unnamed protein product [Effrenium voratum]|uniref:tRNA/rRNA methyltransferase SpoU type domain-containing protein n=1 Tax=Effrenium voratum TaxID=2562239 RepID=A0AA36J6K6_9DINO|nr:unnamed protein product [Effrenium voratum]
MDELLLELPEGEVEDRDPRREERLKRAAKGRLSGLRVVLEELCDPGNRAAILRSVEALGLLHVHEVVATASATSGRRRAQQSSAKGRSIVNGAEKWLNVHQHETVQECVESLQACGFRVFAAMPPSFGFSQTSLPLESFSFESPTALLFGSEARGVSDAALGCCDGAFTVPLVGLSESLNVSVCCGLCAHFGALARRQALKLGPAEGDLAAPEVEALLESYAQRSLDHRFAARLRATRSREVNEANALSRGQLNPAGHAYTSQPGEILTRLAPVRDGPWAALAALAAGAPVAEDPISRRTGPSMSRVSSNGDVAKEERTSPGSPSPAPPDTEKMGDGRGLFHVIEQLAALEGALWSILDGLKSNATHVSFFCREYWGTSASHAQLSLEKLGFHERLKRQVQQACVLESLSLGVASHLCSGTMQGVSVTIRSRLRNLLCQPQCLHPGKYV